MRIAFFVILIAMSAALGYCAINAFLSRKSVGRAVGLLLCALIPPVVGNAIIVFSGDRALSTFGHYLYTLGMNGAVAALANFTDIYCEISEDKKKYILIGYILLAVDTVQLMLNLKWGHAFAAEAIPVEGYAYYRLVPFTGQFIHRLIDYGILGVIILVFILRTINSPRINSERYSVILLILIVTTLWETYYLISRKPIDRSMLGFGAFGIMVYHFSLKYRPRRLLDSMLSHIASGLPEALYFFDSKDVCIWANQSGIELLDIEGEDYEVAAERLRKKFGSVQSGESKQHEIEEGGETRSYVVEKHDIRDERGRLTSSFVSVRDNTADQMTLRAEIHRATHDPLTKVYNRAGYNVLISKMELWKTIMLLIDGDCFKHVNDTYGHEIGDKVLQRIAETIKRCFRSDDYVCRIGGDEFVVLMLHSDSAQKELIIDRISQINEILGQGSGDIPSVSVSVGIAHGRNAKYAEELFEHADQALYATKNNGKNGFTFYEEMVPEKQ